MLQKLSELKQKGGIFELIRFVIVGGAATAVDLIVTFGLFYTTTLHENAITTIAFLVAFFVSYFGHRYFTFQKQGSAVAFFALAVCTLSLRNLIVWLLVTYVMTGLIPLILAMIIVTGITYVVSKFGIFKEKKIKE